LKFVFANVKIENQSNITNNPFQELAQAVYLITIFSIIISPAFLFMASIICCLIIISSFFTTEEFKDTKRVLFFIQDGVINETHIV